MSAKSVVIAVSRKERKAGVVDVGVEVGCLLGGLVSFLFERLSGFVRPEGGRTSRGAHMNVCNRVLPQRGVAAQSRAAAREARDYESLASQEAARSDALRRRCGTADSTPDHYTQQAVCWAVRYRRA